MQIGPYTVDGYAVLAPMAGVTDKPFRALCFQHGAAAVTSEMITADTSLYGSRKSVTRLDHTGSEQPRIAQIVGADPGALADAARANVDFGAQVIDINMGCPAKKVCNRAAGSALLADEQQIARILDAVVGAVEVPVTLKIRTGIDPANRNGVQVARIAQSAGIASLARRAALLWYLTELYALYGEYRGVRIARKHIAWFCKNKAGAAQFRAAVNVIEEPEQQHNAVDAFFRATHNDAVSSAREVA